MNPKNTLWLALLAAFFSCPPACNRSALSGSKLTEANYNQITMGMSKSQVETILGPPTTVETKDMVIFKKTTYRYEDGKKFAMITFKNDEVDSKDTNLEPESGMTCAALRPRFQARVARCLAPVSRSSSSRPAIPASASRKPTSIR